MMTGKLGCYSLLSLGLGAHYDCIDCADNGTYSEISDFGGMEVEKNRCNRDNLTGCVRVNLFA